MVVNSKVSIDVNIANAIMMRAKNIPYFNKKYCAMPEITSMADFEQLPSMDKEDVNATFDDLHRLMQVEGRHAYLFSSGGTLSTPKLSFIPTDMFLEDILSVWKPLDQSDVVCNLFTPGRMWSAHYFYNVLAERLASTIIAFGALEAEEMRTWLDFFQQHHVTALAGTPSTIKQILQFCKDNKYPLFLKKILWVGEACDSTFIELVSTVIPNIELWGLYGSTETWVIGYNTPDCPIDTFHPLPYQYVETIDNGQVLVTNKHPSCVNILLKYKVGDAASWNDHCSCGLSHPSFHLLGRSDDALKFVGTIISPQELVAFVLTFVQVDDAQIALIHQKDGSSRLELRLVGTTHEQLPLDHIRDSILNEYFDLQYSLNSDLEKFQVHQVNHLFLNTRTQKKPLVVREDEF